MFSLSPRQKAAFGVFLVLLAFGGSSFFIGKENFWFGQKSTFITFVEDGEGLREGTPVTLHGLRVGKVTKLSVSRHNFIKIDFSVTKELAKKIRLGTVARIVRSNIIGSKKINLIPGPIDGPSLPQGAVITGKDSREILDLLGGESIEEIMVKLQPMSEGLHKIVGLTQELVAKIRPGDLAKFYAMMMPLLTKSLSSLEVLHPTLENFNSVLKHLDVILPHVKERKNILGPLLVNTNKTFRTVNKDLLETKALRDTVINVNKLAGPLAREEKTLVNLARDLNILVQQFSSRPEMVGKILATLEDVSITLKALQKTWLLEDEVQEVKKGGKNQKNKKESPTEEFPRSFQDQMEK